MACAEGASNKAVAAQLSVTPQMAQAEVATSEDVERWTREFRAARQPVPAAVDDRVRLRGGRTPDPPAVYGVRWQRRPHICPGQHGEPAHRNHEQQLPDTAATHDQSKHGEL